MTNWDGRKWDFRETGEVLLVDKPVDWTSFDVVKKIRVLFDVHRVGHAGTLDPKATGLLIVCTGRMTKSILTFQETEKEYTGTFELGVMTPSFDSETEVTERRDYSHVTVEQLERSTKHFVGRTLQTPPMFSATKFDGRPLYAYARKGEVVERAAREISITDFALTGVRLPFVDFRVVCSKGTYIRALIADVGNELGCGCTLRSLRRTRIGTFKVEDAMTIEDLKRLRQSLDLGQHTHYEVGEPA